MIDQDRRNTLKSAAAILSGGVLSGLSGCGAREGDSGSETANAGSPTPVYAGRGKESTPAATENQDYQTPGSSENVYEEILVRADDMTVFETCGESYNVEGIAATGPDSFAYRLEGKPLNSERGDVISHDGLDFTVEDVYQLDRDSEQGVMRMGVFHQGDC